MTMKIIKLAKPKEFIYPEWTEAIQEAELAERKAKAWELLRKKCLEVIKQDEESGTDMRSVWSPALLRMMNECLEAAISQSCSEGKEGK